MMNRSGTFMRLFAALALAGLAFTAGAARADTRITVGHDWWVGYTGVFVAEAEGYFKEEGLDVTLQMFKGPSESLPPLIAGHLQIAMTTLHNLLLVAGSDAGADFRIGYLLDASNGADAIIAKESIASLADLKGKKVAVNINDLNHMLLIVALAEAGMTDKDVELVNLDPDAAGAAFLAGQIDAAVTWEPWLTRAAASGGRIIYSTAEPAAQNLILNAVVARSDYIAEHPEVFEGYIRATAKGVAFMRENPQRAYEIVAAKLEVTPQEAEAMLQSDKIYGLDDNVTLIGPAGGEPPVLETMGKIQAFLRDNGLVKREADLPAMLDASVVKKLAAE